MERVIIREENKSKVIEGIELKQPTEDDRELARSCAETALEKLGDLAICIKRVVVDFWQFGIMEILGGKFTITLDSGKQKSFIRCLAGRNHFQLADSLTSDIRNFVSGEKLTS